MKRDEFLQALDARLRQEYRQILEDADMLECLDMLAGGKHTRALLVWALAADEPDVVERAVVIELFHAFTLIHDDVIDKAATRRGLPTLSALYGDERAIMIGDIVFARAGRRASEVVSPMLMTQFMEMAERVGAAQDLELRLRGSDRTVDQYLAICKGKTGILMQFTAKCALDGRTSDQETQRYEACVGAIALAFQIIDDIDDVRQWRGSRAHESKQAEYDIELGNFTMPAIIAAHQAGIVLGPESAKELRHLSDTVWDQVLGEVRQQARGYAETGKTSLTPLPSSDTKERFVQWLEPFLAVIEHSDGSVDAIKQT